MENSIIYNDIIEIILKNRGKIKKDISLLTTLRKDLGVDGIDGEEIMSQYFDKFNINSSLFIFTDYFGEEHFGFSQLYRLVFGKKLKDITIQHLVKCVEEGKWTIPNLT